MLRCSVCRARVNARSREDIICNCSVTQTVVTKKLSQLVSTCMATVVAESGNSRCSWTTNKMKGNSVSYLQRQIWCKPRLMVGFLITNGQFGPVAELCVSEGK